jgi:nucleoside-diphosphate-sugar epimerase
VKLPEVNQVIATGRTLKPSHTVTHPKVKYILGDLTDLAFVQSLVAQAQYIVHAAALSSPWGSYASFEAANLTTQQHLIKAALEHQIKRFVFISTPSMYFTGYDRFDIKESDPLPRQMVNAYSQTKRLAELELERSGIAYVTLRPRALVGRGDTVIMPRIIRAHQEVRLKVIGNGKNIVDLTSVANVADAIILSLNTHQGLNETYNITNGEPVKLWDKIALVLELMGKEIPTTQVPYWVVWAAAGAMELSAKLVSGKEPVLTKYGVGVLAKSMTMNISKAQKLLGYSPKVSTDEAIREFVEWYIK